MYFPTTNLRDQQENEKGQNNNNYKKQTCNQKIGKEEILHSGLCIQSRQ